MPVFEVQYSKTYVFLCTDAVEATDAEGAIEEIRSNSRDYEDGVLEESVVEVNSVAEVVSTQPAWVILVTDGTLILFPPELYVDREQALLESRRWAESLMRGGDIPGWDDGIYETDGGTVRFEEVFVPIEREELWIGTHWGLEGAPDPAAAIFPSRDAATAWVKEPPGDTQRSELLLRDHSMSAEFIEPDGEHYSVANRAKVL